MLNRVTTLFGIQYPIIQAGMVWTAGWRLASAVSEAGGLGLIGAGSMYPDVLREHIRKCKKATNKPFGVNVPLLYPDIEKHFEIIIAENVRIVFTSAGNPTKWTPFLKEKGLTVVHVVPGSRYAKKAEAAGCDAVVAEGFEAGGHNGREETTTLCLTPSVCGAVKIPVLAAGGISSGKSMLAAFALGAEGVQIGTRFAASKEASAHLNFKVQIVGLQEGDTVLTLKKLVPVRMVKNAFFSQVQEAENRCASKEELQHLLGSGRAKRGIFEGDLAQGELEIGQVSALVDEIKPAGQILQDIWAEFCNEKNRIAAFRL